MDYKDFETLCINTVYKYVKGHLASITISLKEASEFKRDDIYVVWMCKTLQNNKALLSTRLHDGMYYECTYNGDEGVLYLDAYRKLQNKEFDVIKEEK